MRIAATPAADSDGPRLADEILAAIAPVTREADEERLAAHLRRRRPRRARDRRRTRAGHDHAGVRVLAREPASAGRSAARRVAERGALRQRAGDLGHDRDRGDEDEQQRDARRRRGVERDPPAWRPRWASVVGIRRSTASCDAAPSSPRP